MAFTEFYCNASTGSNVNAGDLTANGIVTSTNGAWSTVTNIFTAASGTPFSGVSVGDFASVYVDGATTAVYIGRVTTVGGGGATLTISSSAKSGTAPTTSGTGRSCTTGGAWKGPNGSSGFPFDFLSSATVNASASPPRINFKNNATYTVSTAISASSGPAQYEGYTSTVGDGGLATLSANGGTIGVLTSSSVGSVYKNLTFTGNATGTAVALVTVNARATLIGCVCSDSYHEGFKTGATGVTFVECEAYNCDRDGTVAAGFNLNSGGVCVRCIAHDNNTYGFRLGNNSYLFDCVADTNTSHGITVSGNSVAVFGLTAYGNGGDGFQLSNTTVAVFMTNSIFVSNGGYGINVSATSPISIVNCAFYSNTSGQTSGTAVQASGSVTLSGNPFNAAATGDFRLNNTSGAGASCRQAGRGAFTETQASYTGTVAYPDIGAVETQVVYPTAAQVQLGVTFDVLAAVTGTYNPGGGGGAILSRAFLGMGAGV